MNLLKIATIKDGDAAITVFYNEYTGGADYWKRLTAEGDADMAKEFLLFAEWKYWDALNYYPREWGIAVQLARMFSEAGGYEIKDYTWDGEEDE